MESLTSRVQLEIPKDCPTARRTPVWKPLAVMLIERHQNFVYHENLSKLLCTPRVKLSSPILII